MPAVFRPNMFSEDRIVRRVPQGITYAEIALSFGVPQEFWAPIDEGLTVGRIQVNGVLVPRAAWEVACPVNADVVTLSMIPGKGMKGAQLAAILGSVVVAGLTLGVGLGFAAPLLGASFAFGTMGAAALSAGIGIVGSVALQMLFPPPGQGDSRARRDKPIAGISANILQPMAQIPGIRGKVTYSPPALHTFTKLIRGTVFAYGLYAVAGRNEVTNVRVNRSLADDLPGVELEIKEGDPSDTAITLVAETGLESVATAEQMSEFDLKENSNPLTELQDQATPTNSYPIWHGFTSRGAGDEIWTRFHAPQGFGQRNSVGDVDPAGVPIRSRLRLLGESAWRNGPEFHFQDDSKLFKRILQEIRWIFEAPPSTFVALSAINKNYVAYIAYGRAADGEAFEWTADPYFQQGGIFADNVEREKDGFKVWLDPSEFPPGVYEVQYMRGLGHDTGTNFNATAYTYTDSGFSSPNFFEHVVDGGTDKVVINQESYQTILAIEQFTTWFGERPVAQLTDWPCPMTFIALKVRDRVIESLSADFHSKVTKWTGSSWSGVDVSSNPGELYRDTLSGLLNAKPLSSTLRNDDNLGAFADFCDGRGYACNMVYSGSVREALEIIAACGFGIPWQKETWGVTWEYDREAEDIVHGFSPLNARLGNAQRPFPDRPLYILAEYQDEDDEYKTKQELVFADGETAASAGLNGESRPYPGFTNRFLAIERATFDLRQMVYRMSKYPIEVGREQLLASKGELVGLGHDIILGGGGRGFALVRDLLFADGGLWGLRLEGIAPLSNVGGPVSVEMLLLDRTTQIEPILETEDTDTITFASPIVTPTADGRRTIDPGSMIVFGAAGDEKRRCLIEAMQLTKEFGAQILLTPEAPELHYPGRAIDLTAEENEFGQVELRWVQPRQSRVSHARIYANTTGIFDEGDLIDNVIGVPGAVKTYTDEPQENDWAYWIEPHDNDGHSGDRMKVTIASAGYDAATIDILERFDALGVSATTARAGLYNVLVETLKAAGVWAELDCFYVFSAHAAAAARVNLKTPGTIDLGEANSPTFSVDAGYAGNGTDKRLNSTFNPSTAGGNWALNSAGLFVWCNTTGLGANTTAVLAGVAASGVNATISSRNSAGNAVGAINVGAATTSAANSDGSGYYAILRDGASSVRFRKNDTSLATDTDASTSLPNGVVRVLCSSTTATTHTDKQLGAVGWGSGFNNTRSDALYNALLAFRNAL